jgi:hypothetical protein
MEQATIASRVLVMYAGCVVMDGAPQEVFEKRERLQALGLGLPPAVEIVHRLREEGVVLPPGLLTVNALAGALC